VDALVTLPASRRSPVCRRGFRIPMANEALPPMSDDIQVDPQSKLSALMDGEVDEFELRRTLDLIDQDPALRGKWRRYQLAASALRGESLSWRDDLSERIAQAVASEPAPRRPVLVGILGRAAVAASVAVLTVAAVR